MDRTPSTPDDWEDHWSRLGDAAESNPAQAFRFHLVRRYLADLGQGSRLLDLRCGTGGLLEYLGSDDLNFDATGLELSAAGVARATERLPDARFIQCDLLAPEPPDLELLGWAEQATCSEVLEHLDNPKLFLERARPLLRPGAPGWSSRCPRDPCRPTTTTSAIAATTNRCRSGCCSSLRALRSSPSSATACRSSTFIA